MKHKNPLNPHDLEDSMWTEEDLESGGEESLRVPNDLVFGEGNYEAIRHTCEAIGQIIESWGFKRIMGMTWAFLYLCPEPACAKDICKALNISPALVSITLQDLIRWGVVKKLSPIGQRRDYYEAEHDVWKMVKKILQEREKTHMEMVKMKLSLALDALDAETKAKPDLKSKRTCQFQRVRIEDLMNTTDMALQLMELLIQDGQVDISPLKAILKPYQFYAQQIQSQLLGGSKGHPPLNPL